MDLPVGYVILGSSGIGILIALFALAYEMIRNASDVRRVIERLQSESKALDVKVKKPDLVQLDRIVKISYKVLKSPERKEKSKEHISDLVKHLLEIRKKMSDLDWMHAERRNLRGLIQLHGDSEERLKDIMREYRAR